MFLIDTSHPMYRPLWVRLLIVGFCAAWTVVEFINHQIFWATVVGGIAVYSAYVLLIAFKPGPAKDTPAAPPAQRDE